MREAGGKAVTDPERPAYYIEKPTDGAYLMFYEKPMPFYMAYPVPWLFDQEKEQDRDLQVMKSFYSARAPGFRSRRSRNATGWNMTGV